MEIGEQKEFFTMDVRLNTTEHQTQRLKRYVQLLIVENERARLTGPSDEQTLWDDHVMDCLHSVSLLPEYGSVIDVGTGGGLPGIVWAICRPDLKITLLDSITRKCAGIQNIVDAMELPNVRVTCCRSEDFAQTHRERFTLAGARAVCAAGILAEYLSPLVKVGGTLLAFKGPKVTEELEAVKRPWAILGLKAPTQTPYTLGEKERCFLVWEKSAPCPSGYPRRPGLAEKNPWFELPVKEKRKPSHARAKTPR